MSKPEAEMGLHKPGKFKVFLNALHFRQITLADIGNAHAIMARYPSMAGDPDLGIGNVGNCPDLAGDWGWHKIFLEEQGVK